MFATATVLVAAERGSSASLPLKRTCTVSVLRPAKALASSKATDEEKLQLLRRKPPPIAIVRLPALKRTATRPSHARARPTPAGGTSETEVVKRYGGRRSASGVTRAVSRRGASRGARDGAGAKPASATAAGGTSAGSLCGGGSAGGGSGSGVTVGRGGAGGESSIAGQPALPSGGGVVDSSAGSGAGAGAPR